MRDLGEKEEISILFDRNLLREGFIGKFVTISGSRKMPQKGRKKE